VQLQAQPCNRKAFRVATRAYRKDHVRHIAVLGNRPQALHSVLVADDLTELLRPVFLHPGIRARKSDQAGHPHITEAARQSHAWRAARRGALQQPCRPPWRRGAVEPVRRRRDQRAEAGRRQPRKARARLPAPEAQPGWKQRGTARIPLSSSPIFPYQGNMAPVAISPGWRQTHPIAN
jgi:hypothetical protein